MAVGLQSILVGIGWLALVAIVPSILVWLCVWLCGQAPRVVDAVRERLAAGQQLSGHGQPIEELASDLRRLRAELVTKRPTNNVRRTALLEAYDDVLADMCGRLELPTVLADLPLGRERDVERLRAEAAIQDAGIALRLPTDRHGHHGRPAEY